MLVIAVEIVCEHVFVSDLRGCTYRTQPRIRVDVLIRRGRAACRSEWRLLAATHNLLKLYRATARPASRTARSCRDALGLA